MLGRHEDEIDRVALEDLRRIRPAIGEAIALAGPHRGGPGRRHHRRQFNAREALQRRKQHGLRVVARAHEADADPVTARARALRRAGEGTAALA